MKGLEPPRREAPDPKSGAAANYATSAIILSKLQLIYKFSNNTILKTINKLFSADLLFYFQGATLVNGAIPNNCGVIMGSTFFTSA